MSEKTTFEDVFSGDDSEDWEFLDDETFEVEDSKKKSSKKEVTDEDEEEEEEELEEEEEEEDDKSDDESDESEEEEEEGEGNENLLSYITAKWADSGLVSIPEGMDIENEDDLDKIIEHTIQEQVSNYKNSLSSDSKSFIEFIEKGGRATDYIQISSKEDYANIESSDEEGKLEAIKELYKRKGLSSNRINTLVTALEDNEEIDEEFEDAKKFFKDEKESELKEIEDTETARRALQQSEQADREKTIKDLIKNSSEINDFPITTKKSKDELTSYIFDRNNKYVDDNGNAYMITQYQLDKVERQKVKEVKFEDIIFDALYTKNKGKLTSIKKKGVTEHSNKFKELSKQYKQQSTASKLATGGGKNSKKSSKSKSSFNDWLALD
jgi:hypothetical protein